MRQSQLLGKTLRDAPADADTINHRLLVRAGMVNQLAAGVYSFLPLGRRVLTKIENIIRDEMNKAGGQEVTLPVLQPLDLWQLTGRDKAFGESLMVVTDRKERKLALGPTHEEVVTQLVGKNVQSYRDLPLLVYQIQTKFRDEPRPRGGLIRCREFIMKDLYSFDVDEAALDVSYQKMLKAYKHIYDRCGLPSLVVEADSGAIGGKDSHEFMVIAESGEDELIYCPKRHYAANVEKAQSVKLPARGGDPLPLEEVATPGAATIPEVANFLKVPESQTLKAVFYIADGKLVFVAIRGDLDVNEVKLKNLLHPANLRLATDPEVREAGIVAGAASPVGLKGVRVIADQSVTSGANFVAGANKPETHLKNVNYPRNFTAETVADIAKAKPGDGCPRCGEKLEGTHGIEVGHVFKLGTFLSQKLGASYLDEKGVSRPAIMGCYGIGVGRLLAAAVEQNHDDKGIIWPAPIAPYHVHLCPLYREGSNVKNASEKLYALLQSNGIEVLIDDRKESPGIKFNDADLIGIPIRITISPRTLEKDSVELKLRREKQAELLPIDRVLERVRQLLGMGGVVVGSGCTC